MVHTQLFWIDVDSDIKNLKKGKIDGVVRGSIRPILPRAC